MSTIPSRTFEHAGNTYEVRIGIDGHTFEVRAYLDGEPANPYAYTVRVETQLDAAMSDAPIDPLESLIELAEHDVRKGTFEKYLKAVRSLRNDP